MSDNEVKTTVSNERLQIWLNFVKFLLGTVALGVVTLLINSEIQTQRLEFEIKSKENDFIAQFVDNALDENLEKRRDFAEYFVRLTPTQESKKRWEGYRDYTQDLLEESERVTELIEERERELSSVRDKLETSEVLAREEVATESPFLKFPPTEIQDQEIGLNEDSLFRSLLGLPFPGSLQSIDVSL